MFRMAETTARRDHRDIGYPHRTSGPGSPAGDPRGSWGPPCGPGWMRAHPHRRVRHRGPLRRRRDDRFLGGVAGMLSGRTGIDVTFVRVGQVIFGLASGIGVAAYVVAWLVIPFEDEPESI